MAEVRVLEAAFAGYGLIRRRPLAFGVWAVLLIAATALQAWIGTEFLAGPLQEISAIGADPTEPADPFAVFLPVGRLFAGYGVLTLCALSVTTLLHGAVYRAYFRPEATGLPIPGADEVRLFVVNAVIWLLLLTLGFFAWLLFFFVLGVAQATAGVGNVATLVALGVFVLLLTGVYVFLGVKFSLAPAQTVAERKMRFFESWALTKGRFWRALGAYLTAFASLIPLWLVAFFALAAFQFAIEDQTNLTFVFVPQAGDFLSGLSPVMIAYFVIWGLAGAVVQPVTMAPAAAILRSQRADDLVEVF